MSRSTNRRAFLQESAAIGIGLWAGGGMAVKESLAASEQVRFACIGIGGKGTSDSADAGKHGDVVAICDIDDSRLDTAASEKFPKAQRFNDYRKLFDEVGKNIDAVTVSTPDHHHAFASIMAMKLGKACFCQKPLTHSVSEARMMAHVAREMKVATQMGNQGTSNDSLRKAAALIRSGHLGTIKEVHVWTDRPVWPQGGARPKPAESIPETVHWEQWVGPAPFREYAPGYHDFKWRGWWDFGTGALGDMACHTFNMPYMALDLKNPISIEAEHSGHNRDSYPNWSIIKFFFPSTDSRPAIPVTWYDGGERPEKELFGGKDLPKAGALIVGDKDTLHAHGDYCDRFTLLSGSEPPQVDFVKSPGHFVEFINTIKGGPEAVPNFPNYSGPLTETILLGNLAVWAGKGPDSEGKKLEWDSSNLRATNAPEVDVIVKRPYREGWTL
jgi:predicted dehydrogenase